MGFMLGLRLGERLACWLKSRLEHSRTRYYPPLMRNLAVDDDIYDFVCQNTKEIGESASSILRRLLKLPATEALDTRASEITAGQTNASGARITDLQSHLNKLTTIQVVDRFLTILGWIRTQDSEKFEGVKNIRGPQRIYFSRNKVDIEKSGCGTAPKQIPGSDWFVLTNSDTQTKKQLLMDVLELFSFTYDEKTSIVNLLESPQQRVAY